MLQRLLGLFRGKRAATPPELRGRPSIRREKVYAADSGYVYQYTYEGYCSTARDGSEGRDFVFGCTSDRASRFGIVVFAPDESFVAWERHAGRELTAVEHYAIVKMRLFEIFDESEHVSEDLVEVLTAEQVERQIETLDL